jgi:hypothetical protein
MTGTPSKASETKMSNESESLLLAVESLCDSNSHLLKLLSESYDRFDEQMKMFQSLAESILVEEEDEEPVDGSADSKPSRAGRVDPTLPPRPHLFYGEEWESFKRELDQALEELAALRTTNRNLRKENQSLRDAIKMSHQPAQPPATTPGHQAPTVQLRDPAPPDLDREF